MASLIERSADLEIITIYEISKILTSSLDFQKAVRGVLNVLLSHLQMRRGMVSLVQEPGTLHLVCATGIASGRASRVKYEFGEGILGRIVKSDMPMVIPDVSKEPLFLNRTGRDTAELQKLAFIGVPIRAEGRPLGVLNVDRKTGAARPVNFDRDVRILSLVANLIGQTWKLHQSVAAERKILIEEKQRLQKQLQGDYDIENVVGKSRRIKEVFADVHQAAPGNATILLRGESGTGKEAIAHAIHYLSPRAKGPFVKVNCASLPETLLESELFGHEKGAFTGATAERRGRFEMADKGTLFLDEIGDISPAFQAKLLRVLQEREFERVGGTRTLRADFRLVAATNRNLEEMVTRGEFRADLYFRLNVVTIFLPALRERKEDIPLLVDFFLERFNRESGRVMSISPEALEIFMRCNWPGNVRELENCVERAATMCRGRLICEADMRCQRGQCFSAMLLETVSRGPFPAIAPPSSRPPAVAASPSAVPNRAPDAGGEAPDGHVSERDCLIEAMEKCGWVQAKAARRLKLTPRQMGYALRKYNIEVKRL